MCHPAEFDTWKLFQGGSIRLRMTPGRGTRMMQISSACSGSTSMPESCQLRRCQLVGWQLAAQWHKGPTVVHRDTGAPTFPSSVESCEAEL